MTCTPGSTALTWAREIDAIWTSDFGLSPRLLDGEKMMPSEVLRPNAKRRGPWQAAIAIVRRICVSRHVVIRNATCPVAPFLVIRVKLQIEMCVLLTAGAHHINMPDAVVIIQVHRNFVTQRVSPELLVQLAVGEMVRMIDKHPYLRLSRAGPSFLQFLFPPRHRQSCHCAPLPSNVSFFPDSFPLVPK